MALSINSIRKLHKSLEYNFLYNNDLNSMQLLLTMLESDDKIKKLRPKYVCMNSIKRGLNRLLDYRRDRSIVVRAISKLINDDINRLELSMYLESYSLGYENIDWVNRIESYAVKHMSMQEISSSNILYHDSKNPEIIKLKNNLDKEIISDNINLERIKRITATYLNRVVRSKVYSINSCLDAQLMISYRNSDILIKDEEYLTIPELTEIYDKITSLYTKSIIRIYKNSYWYGINDRVLNRY